jgi:hypothetical protein
MALPAWSAEPAASPGPAPQVTLADILAPVPAPAASGLGIVTAFACFPPCTSDAYCQSLCECTVAFCYFSSSCQKRICNCTVCP